MEKLSEAERSVMDQVRKLEVEKVDTKHHQACCRNVDMNIRIKVLFLVFRSCSYNLSCEIEPLSESASNTLRAKKNGGIMKRWSE